MSKPYYTMDDIDLPGKRVLIRLDVNSPLDPETGKFLDDARVRLHLDTLRELEDSKVVILAHQSRPGKSDFTTLEEHAKVISDLLGRQVSYIDSLHGSAAQNRIQNLKNGDMVILENTRFYAEEVVLKAKSPDDVKDSYIVKKLNPYFDCFINDAFAAAHRSQPTLTGFCTLMPSAAGLLMDSEITALSQLFEKREKPRMAILGGIKVDDSLSIMKNMLDNDLVDTVLTVGGVGQMFMMARGQDIGKESTRVLMKLVDNYIEHLGYANRLLDKYKDRIEVPIDVAVNINGERVHADIGNVPQDYPINDIGLETIAYFTSLIESARSIVLNGPAGVFELEAFAHGTEEILAAMAYSKAYTVVGGGHTGAAAHSLGYASRLDHVSSGGGACLSFLSGKTMPAIEALKISMKMFKDPNKRECSV